MYFLCTFNVRDHDPRALRSVFVGYSSSNLERILMLSSTNKEILYSGRCDI